MARPTAIPRDCSSLTEAIAGFCRYLRKEGFGIGTGETLGALSAARLGLLEDRAAWRRALRSLLASDRQQYDRFGALFEAYWTGAPRRRPNAPPAARALAGSRRIPILLLAAAKTPEPEQSEHGSGGASAAEALRKKDFARAAPDDEARLEALAERLFRLMSLRLSRQLKPTRLQGHLDLRRTIRRSIPRGGTPVDLAHRARRPRRPHLAVLLDVSASMDRYSFFLLRFVHALGRHFARTDSFVFSTRLRCVTHELRRCRHPGQLAELATESEAWRGGTRIGACLEDFRLRFGHRALSGNTVVLILSDGLDTGEPAQLARQVSRIRRRARKVLWLTPLLGMEGYEPLTRGIQAVLPHVDQFLPAHNLESLLRLEAHLRHA